MEKQYKNKKALQPGILSECNYMETLAKVFHLNKCLDFDSCGLNDIPIECRTFLNSGKQTYSSARYLYYNPKQPEIFLFQYGNPASGDAEIIINGNKVRLEFKERNSKAGEYDITGLYNESGMLLISEEFKNSSPEYIPFVEKFNSETNMIKEVGSNYSNFDDEMKVHAIVEYFSKHKIDVLISSSKEDELIALTPDCVQFQFPDGKKIITTENSEIRSSGRNHKQVFTKNFFQETLKKIEAVEAKDGVYEASLNNKFVEIIKGRGKNKDSRIQFNKVFFIDINDAKIANDRFYFNVRDVRQKVPTISMHMQIQATKKELKEYFRTKEGFFNEN